MASCGTCGILPDTIQQMSTRLNSIDDALRNLTSLLLPIVKTWNSSSSESSTTLKASRSSSEWFRSSAEAPSQKSELPVKLWERIFFQLNARQLSNVRESCRHWRRIVDDNSALMGKFEVSFPEGVLMDREYEPERLLPVPKAKLRKARIVTVATWWGAFGVNLSWLKLSDCKVSLATLLEMFRGMPNLKILELIQVECSGICNKTENFRLGKLEQLIIEGSETAIGLLNVFGLICTDLKDFKLLIELSEIQSERRVIRFLQSVRNTLEDVEICATPRILQELTASKQIRLKRVKFCNWLGINNPELVKFCKEQATLEELEITEVATSNETLCEIVSNLPSLARLAVKIDSKGAVLPTFLDRTPQLTHLAISGVHATRQLLNLTLYGTANLTELKLSNLRLTCCSLQRFCNASPNVRAIELKCCLFESWSEIFSAAERCRKLERLQLDRIRVNRNDDFLVQYFDGLRYLELSDCKLPNEMLATLFRLCPLLEEIYLWRMANFNGEVMLCMCQKLKRLKKLTFNNCLFGDDFAECIVNYCQQLEELNIWFCDKLSNSSEALLRTTRNIQLMLK